MAAIHAPVCIWTLCTELRAVVCRAKPLVMGLSQRVLWKDHGGMSQSMCVCNMCVVQGHGGVLVQ
jgi:hypothetical protein